MFGACAGFISGVFATTALLLSFLASFWCQSFKFTLVVDPPNYDGDTDIHMSQWFQQTTTINTASTNGDVYVWSENYCVQFWVAPNLDAYWKASQAFSIIAVVLGGLGSIALCCSCCCPEHFTTDRWRSLALKFSVLVTLSQGLTLLYFKSIACTDNNVIQALEASSGGIDIYNNTCVWDKGSSINVASIVCWFLTGVSMILIGPPSRDEEAEPRGKKKSHAENENDAQ